MSDIPPTPPFLRHALGLPAGSVRALLAACVMTYLWVLALTSGFDEGKATGPLSQKGATTAFVYMELMMFMVVCSFFVAHGKTIGKVVSKNSPLYLPRFLDRVVLLVAYFGLAYWTFKNWSSIKFDPPDLETIILVLAIVLAAFLVGHMSSSVMRLLSGGVLPFWFQNIQAWVGLIALVLLAWVLLARGVINPSITEQLRQFGLEYTEPAMAACVAFYYGARS